MNTLYIFSDGSARSYENYTKFDGSHSYVIIGRDNYGNETEPTVGGFCTEDTTLPRCELKGLYGGLMAITTDGVLRDEYAKYQDIVCVSDSALTVQSLNLWIHGWLRKTRKQNSEVLLGGRGPVKNQDIIMKIYNLMTTIRKQKPLRLYHINSHVTTSKEMKDAFKKFIKFNAYEPNHEEFMFMVKGNVLADTTANKIFEENYDMSRYRKK